MKIKISALYKSIIVIVIGLILCSVCAPLSTNVNFGVALGILIMIIGSIMLFFALYGEFYRIGIDLPFPFGIIFPNYPVVEDDDKIKTHLSGFRKSFGEYLSDDRIKDNSSLQEYSSQILWHCIYLWKERMDKSGITLDFDSSRRAYTSKKNAVRCEEYFDGRYVVKDIYEEIDATRKFKYQGKVIKSIRDKEVAHYTLLSCKETEDNKVICPNCGAQTSRSNLIDGCDYCDTKFTVEDIDNSVGGFGFRRDFQVSASKQEAIKALIYPWVFLITEMPFIYFGFFGAFLYMDESVIARLITGLIAAGLFGLLGWFFVKVNMAIVLPFAYGYSKSHERMNLKMAFRTKEAEEQERTIAEYVRGFDGKFSIQSFFGGIQNKILAIHFAERDEQINAFSDCDLAGYLNAYRNIVDVDVSSMTLCSYQSKEGTFENKDGEQTALVRAELVLRDFINGRIKEHTEQVELNLVKSGRCKTQAVCAPSVLKCDSCGSSRSLMDGKKCTYCGHELDMRKYDWVINGYKSTIRR